MNQQISIQGFLRKLRPLIILSLLTITNATSAFAGEESEFIPVNPFMITPFVLLLLAIAVMPFIAKHWWEKNYPKVSISLGLVTIGYYVFGLDNSVRMMHSLIEYVSFIALIGSLFIVAGGIHIRLRGKSTPMRNVGFLALGGLVANVLGTTGASMIMIRPFMRVNHYRLKPFHIVFFIFIISNIGGALTPIGDPPLFLGYLKGVPFFWVIANVWQPWVFTIIMLLFIFYVLDFISFRRYEKQVKNLDESQFDEDAEISGWVNIVFLLIIIGSIFIQNPPFLREFLMVVGAVGSIIFTKKEIRLKNNFNYEPLKEVSLLFFGIFATMVPALDWLEMNAMKIGITTAGHFYWGSGLLSSVLDNAPTYLNFLSASMGLLVDSNAVKEIQQMITTHGANISNVSGAFSEETRNAVAVLVKYHMNLLEANNVPLDDIRVAYLIGNSSIYLKAISVAAVYFGASTYIGNGPNFMVKSIADHARVKTPGFFGYIFKYAIPILLPVFIVVWWVWFR